MAINIAAFTVAGAASGLYYRFNKYWLVPVKRTDFPLTLIRDASIAMDLHIYQTPRARKLR